MENYLKITTVIIFFSMILVILPTAVFAASQCDTINSSDYIPRSIQFYYIDSTNCLILNGNQIVGWNIREYEDNSKGGTLEGIDPNKEYILIEYEYRAFQFYPHFGPEHESVYVIIDPDSKEALYYGANWHYQKLLYEPKVANPFVSFLPDFNTPIFLPPTTAWYNNLDAKNNSNEHLFIDNNPDVPLKKDKEYVKGTVDYSNHAYIQKGNGV